MEHNLFKSKNLEQGKHSVVGDCNGFSMQERWDRETPVFAREILKYAANAEPGFTILDYGCGVGRLAKEILKQNPNVTVIGVDDSADQLKLAKEYVNDSRFIPVLPHELNQKVDLAYCVYVLQHVPAIELRSAIQRMHHFLKTDAYLIYCSSDYRMSIRFDDGGFFDDRFLGVNIQEELSRYFFPVIELFNPMDPKQELDPVVSRMVFGKDLPHPAIVFKKKQLKGQLFNALPYAQTSITFSHTLPAEPKKEAGNRLILRNRLSPGDVLVMSVAIRALKKAFPHYEIDVDTPTNEIFENSPYITKLNGNGQVIDMHYPEIHKSGASGRHFVDGHRKYLEEVLEIEIPRVGLLPDIFLTHAEKQWTSPVFNFTGYDGEYWVINAGSKSDYTLKQYHRWQEVADLWKQKFPGIELVQIGQLDHNHAPLKNVIDMRGKTNIRELFRLIHKSQGVLSCVSFPMHVAAALEKPCVVVAGGREGTRWELYPSHRFLYTNGALDCCLYDGCWKSKVEECAHPVKAIDHLNQKQPLCMEMIRPEDIIRACELYYLGGVLKNEVANV